MDRTGDEDRVGGEGFSIQQVLFKVCPLGNPTPCPCIKCVPCCWDVVDADGMAEGMLRRHPAPAALPEKVRGVFWFKTNAAPELLFTLHGAGIDADAREAELRRRLHASVAAKLPGHGINDPTFIQPLRPMSAIGG